MGLIGAIAVVDIITKAFFRASLSGGGRIEVLGGLLNFNSYANTGKVLGLFDDYFSLFFFIGIIVLIYLLLMHIFATPSRWLVGAECAIFGGALGNVIDKLMDGIVTDFITINLPVLRDVAFNLADVFIICGALAALPLGLLDIFEDRRTNAGGDITGAD